MSIVDLCLRKIKCLEEIIAQDKARRSSMSNASSAARHRLNQSMHSVSSSNADRNQSQMALEDFRDQHSLIIECYDVVCALFIALDRSIRDEKESGFGALRELLHGQK